MDFETLQNTSLFPVGEENTAYAPYFDGLSYLHMLSLDQVIVGNVTFTPGCRNHWHVHRASQGGGQILLVTAGRGYYQEWGQPARELHPGDVVNIPPTSSTGTGRPRTASSSTWPSRSPARTPAASG